MKPKKRKKSKDSVIRWALSHSRREFTLKIVRKHFEFENCQPKFFSTRKEAREYNIKKYDYIKHREDLRKWPHYWRMPNVVRVKITIEEL